MGNNKKTKKREKEERRKDSQFFASSFNSRLPRSILATPENTQTKQQQIRRKMTGTNAFAHQPPEKKRKQKTV